MDYDTCMEKYTSIWEQVTERFADYGDHLILESMNEEGCFDDLVGTATAALMTARRRRTALSTASTSSLWIWYAVPGKTTPGGIY